MPLCPENIFCGIIQLNFSFYTILNPQVVLICINYSGRCPLDHVKGLSEDNIFCRSLRQWQFWAIKEKHFDIRFFFPSNSFLQPDTDVFFLKVFLLKEGSIISFSTSSAYYPLKVHQANSDCVVLNCKNHTVHGSALS